MKNRSARVERRLRRKAVKILDYIGMLRRSRGMSQADLAREMEVKPSYLSRVLNSIGDNLTLDTIAKFEEALQANIIVTPIEYEQELVRDPSRLLYLMEIATTKNEEFCSLMESHLRNKIAWGLYHTPSERVTSIAQLAKPYESLNPKPRVNVSTARQPVADAWFNPNIGGIFVQGNELPQVI